MHDFRSADRHGAFDDDDRKMIDQSTNSLGNIYYLREIGRAVQQWRCADTDHQHFAMLDRLLRRSCKSQTIVFDTVSHKFAKTWLIKRHFTQHQSFDSLGVNIDAYNLMSDRCQTCGRNKTDIARTKNRNFHRIINRLHFLRRSLLGFCVAYIELFEPSNQR